MHQMRAEASRLVSGTASKTRGGRTRCHQRQGDWSDRGERCVSRPPNATPPLVVGATGRAGDETAGKWRRPAYGPHQIGVRIWTPASAGICLLARRQRQASTRCSSTLAYPLLTPVHALIGWRDRGRLIEAFDCLREEQRGQVSRAC